MQAEERAERAEAAITTVFLELAGALQRDASSDIVEAVRRLRAERDRLRAVIDGYVDDLSHIAFAVAPHAGAVHHDDILTLVQVVVGERDHLRTAATGFKAERDRLRDDLAVERQNTKVLQRYADQAIENAVSAEAERDRLRAVVEAVWPYADHRGGCAVEDERPCDCGFRSVFPQRAQLDVSPTGEGT
jgi:uncharacterized coiled-coil DUF342 family protein